MPNPNPSKARKARTKKAATKKAATKLKIKGSVEDVLYMLWEGMSKVSDKVSALPVDADTTELCKLVHCLSQTASTYGKILETSEFEEKLAELSAALEALTGGAASA